MLKRSLVLSEPFVLENGQQLPQLEIAYHIEGDLDDQDAKVIWVCHPLTANSNPFEWWEGMFDGEDGLLSTNDHYVAICVNMLGSPYGTTNPFSIAEDGEPYFHRFPKFTIRDMARVYQRVKEALKISKIDLLIGASIGGQQALEWAIQKPNDIENLVLIASNAKHSAWGVAFNESQRLAIEADGTWKESNADAGAQGLKAARSIALLSYRNHTVYNKTQDDEQSLDKEALKAQSYQRYQGEKLVGRFNAFSYYRLSQAMDSQNVGRDRDGVNTALSLVKARTLVISMKDDILFPVEEQLLLAREIPDAQWTEIDTLYGHDGFLVDTELVKLEIKKFIKTETLDSGETFSAGQILNY